MTVIALLLIVLLVQLMMLALLIDLRAWTHRLGQELGLSEPANNSHNERKAKP